ncbi:MAG TPA: ABC transporter ATP-binding protein [Alphaproteobacteria bacterium]|nr:ABC transporter ATP-binding protein [Alphaproteobacteria bacterium]MDP6271723.1 ABC transporter ATP-binding protein [Alphaproteobacteria bacterium]MDP7429346.1 ABC transporter ATP-binding protein [Alphaproteobacteria bacterium]HJM49709.1 ABC transporter ATP-binding protein [Alphaproteobacteria bacterium]
MSPPLLEVREVSMSFGALRALDSVGFEVAEGMITGIIGPNGAGKTTLFNVLAGKYRPTTGQVTFLGNDITGFRPDRICKMGISRTYQSARPFPGLSVANNVRVALLYGRADDGDGGAGTGRRSAEEEIGEILDFVELEHQAAKRGEELIPIERKRLELARALATEPRLLLLDELVAGLTPAETTEMMATIRTIRERGVTILLIEHVMKAVMGLSENIIVLHHGEMIAQGDPEAVARDESVIAAYLGSQHEV